MSQEITPKNIYNYFQGHSRQILANLGVTSKHIEEQVAYRLLTCKDTCLPNKECSKCGCDLPQRAFTTESCNLDKFPDLMNEEDWIKYKLDNGIK